MLLEGRKVARFVAWGALWIGFIGVYEISSGFPLDAKAARIGALAFAGLAVSWGVNPSRNWLVISFTLCLATGLAAMTAQHWVYARSLVGLPARVATVGISRLGPIQQLSGPVSASRSWQSASPLVGAKLVLDARSIGTTGSGQWQPVGNDVSIHVEDGSSNPSTIASFGSGRESALTRLVIVGPESIAGHAFRVRFEARTEGSAAAQRPIVAISDRSGGGIRTWAIDYGDGWQAHEYIWRAEGNAQEKAIVVSLRGLGGRTLGLRSFSTSELVDGTWVDIGNQPRIALIISSGGDASKGQVYETTLGLAPDWRHYASPIAQLPSGRVALRVISGSGTVVQLRNLRVVPALGRRALRPAAATSRMTIGQLPPNLVGHSGATVVAGALAAAGPVPLVLLASVLGVAVAWLSGSRTALLGLLLASTFFVWGRRRSIVVGWLVVLLALVGALASPTGRKTLERNSQEVANRPAIWSTAWDALLQYPARGLPGDFAEFWASEHPKASVVTHAHNLWLQFASSYGVPGLAAILWLSAGLVVLAWRWGRWRGLGVLVPVLAMNVFDYTLFFSGVLFPLLIGLNSIRDREAR